MAEVWLGRLAAGWLVEQVTDLRQKRDLVVVQLCVVDGSVRSNGLTCSRVWLVDTQKLNV
jgi:hypothetical protein